MAFSRSKSIGCAILRLGPPGRKVAGCCHLVASLLPVLLPLKCLTENGVADVATLRSAITIYLLLGGRKSRRIWIPFTANPNRIVPNRAKSNCLPRDARAELCSALRPDSLPPTHVFIRVHSRPFAVEVLGLRISAGPISDFIRVHWQAELRLSAADHRLCGLKNSCLFVKLVSPNRKSKINHPQ
jgi:hypothetical protein